MSSCPCCKGEIRIFPEIAGIMNYTNPTREAREYCDICEVLLPHIIGRMTDDIHSREDIEALREDLGSPGNEPRKIWRAIRKMEGDEWGWAYNDSEPCGTRLFEHYPRWSLNEEEMDYIERFDSRRPLDERYTENTNLVRSLQQGGKLPDGSHLCWANGRFLLDGIPMEVPYRGLLKVLDKGRILEGFDWRGVIRSLDLLCCLTKTRGRMEHMENTTLHPAGVLNWFEHRRGHGNRGRDRLRNFEVQMRAMGPGGFSNGAFRKVRSFDVLYRGLEWRDRWGDAQVTDLDEYSVPVTLQINKGRLQARVLRNQGWKRMELESHPVTWAKMMMWALSPPDHSDFQKLLKIQQGLFSDTRESLLSDEDIRGVNLLRTVVDSNASKIKVFRPNASRNSGYFDVRGTSGLLYRIRPGMGAHNTRFSVHGVDDRETDWGTPRDRGICIVEQRELRGYVIGDSIGMVMLTLLDDVNSQRRIETLRDHMKILLTMEQRQSLGADVMMQLNGNPAETIVRRYTHLFPILWRVMLSRPLMSTMIFTAMNEREPNIFFEGCRTTFSTAGNAERRAIYQMLEASGWRRDREQEEERELTRVYLRDGVGEVELGNMVEGFCDILEPFANGRVRLIPHPLWTYFERRNPLPGDLLPEHNQALF